ncbi:cytochrome P450 77A3 [Cynara cardunculus var. scolymus]|uniref:Cytochrome P450 n=1 Tax=Cynara cardunculus var. scolymus TaxID=59895 RepID=A0A103XU61_CYNCS|nr:cytochrome P450 77A3 [Cynara cardunculus var. scolymus]KVH96934.1 cytochrome P450 [Cynara cardunculus var. scolymus]
MESFDIVLAFLTCSFCCFWLIRRSIVSSGMKNLPPGPPGWPIVGNLVQVILQKRPFMYVVRDLRAKYGPIFTMQMGQRTLIIVTSSDLIHEALVQKGSTFASRPPDSPIRLLFSVGKCAINSAQYGPLWRTLRRNFVTELINPIRIRQCGWIRKWALEEHLKMLESENSQHGFVEVMSTCRLTICSILICLCFGARISKGKIKNIESILKDVMMITMPKLPDFMPVLLPLFRRQLVAAKELRRRQMECLVPLVRARRVFCESREDNIKNPSINRLELDSLEMVSPVGAAYIDSLFNLEPAGRGRLGEEELVTLVSEVINAGTDTSATTVEWALLHLVMNQEIQEKLYHEIIRKVGVNGVVQESDVEDMAYLNAVVKETFRRHPPSHFVLSHAATEPTELGGYVIPPDVNVEFYTAWLTEDPDVWEAPEEFWPERFLNGGEGANVDVTGMRGVKMLPFGAGRRICPAWSLGTLHVNMLLARMVHAFKWIPVPGHPPDPTETFAFTVVMKNPLKATILPRNKT